MKISLRWVLDHINVLWENFDVEKAVHLFNEKTAEIEHVAYKKFDKNKFELVKINENPFQKVSSKEIVRAAIQDRNRTEIMLPYRKDIKVSSYYIVVNEASGYRFATEVDFGGIKDSFLPSLFFANKEAISSWRNSICETDVVLDIDNKSITHRPDLWSHRGIAREIAAHMNFPLKKESEFLVELPDVMDEKEVKDYPITISLQTDKCTRFSGMYFQEFPTKNSLLLMLFRLSCIEEKAINLTVDATNYILFDIGQPMHAFDAEYIFQDQIVVGQEHKKPLELLDGQKINLVLDDIVISDTQKPLALAGIKGGRSSGVTDQTKKVFLEAANFDATTIRHSCQRHKIRTSASARFEKSLDPCSTTTAIKRFLKIMNDSFICYSAQNHTVTVGKTLKQKTITIDHLYITDRLGVELEQSFIIQALEKIGFKVTTNAAKGSLQYNIVIPSYRATKDILIKDDIVEEIVRLYGYSLLPRVLPSKSMQPHNLNESYYKKQSMKEFFSYRMKMREIYSYAFFDEDFLKILQWNPENYLTVKNPVSEKYKRLVTSLIPGLLQSLYVNHKQEKMNFFEFGTVWNSAKSKTCFSIEKLSVAGVFFDKKNVDFYQAKQSLIDFFRAYDISVEWRKSQSVKPWFMAHQTADLYSNGVCIGTAGKAAFSFLHACIEGDAFVFELDGSFLLSYKAEQKKYQALLKHEQVIRDITVEVPSAVTAQNCIDVIVESNELISEAFLRDMYQKKDSSLKALTFRFVIQPQKNTLMKEVIDAIEGSVYDALKKLSKKI